MKKHQFRLLVIEDDADLRDYVVDNLRQSYEVFQAADGKEGWDKVFSCDPNLVISDIKLPLIDGIQLTKKIKSDKRTQHLPVILLTALNREEDQIKGLNSGANDYLIKPFNFDILHIKVRNLLALTDMFKNSYGEQIIVAQVDADIKSSGDKFLSMAINYIETNIKSPKLSVADLSAHLGRSRVALYNRILELTGKPPVEFIRSYKLEKAADLLIKSDIAVSQIAMETGFATAHYFSKSFKDKFGVLPSEYRAANLKSANS
ncbi:response regulator [Mucilaginibacter sp. ZT4R22]|uniref:Response regulator n=1 Tax=Mucilaginibacter pankratovii TaxID=2772110 RepID=A0ABR7WNR3_9SPHI|nr:response regulator [Mucilaginibacter pankratovii]MBD1363127.1 response regulator [Mucilaginibacter pankratovii]